MKDVIQGKFTGTGSAFYVALGFIPSRVKLNNQTDLNIMEWHDGLTDAHLLLLTSAPALTEVTSAGITPYAGGDTVNSSTFPVVDIDGNALANGVIAPPGFQVGTNADLNTATEVITYEASRQASQQIAADANYTDTAVLS